VRLTAVVAALCIATTSASAAKTDVEAWIDVDRRAISGSARFVFENPTADPIDRAYVWLHANRFAERPDGLTDVNFHWVYPDRFEPGWTRITRVSAGVRELRAAAAPHGVTGEGTLVEIALPAPLAPGATQILRVDFQTLLPERYGAFGCVHGGCVIAGGFHPLLATIDEAGWDLAAPPLRGELEVRLTSRRPSDVRIVSPARSTHATVVVAPELHETLREHAGVTLRWISRDAPPPAPDAAEQIFPYVEEDYGAMALDAAAEAVDLLGVVGAPVAPGTTITLVEAPLRMELAEAHPGAVLVSDRLFRLFPVEKFRKFHERELVRAIYASIVGDRLAHLPARERDPAAEAAASWLLELYTLKEWRKDELARDLLKPVSFVPQIDQLLYAPQIAFADAYFGAVADLDRFRVDVRRFMHERPRGHQHLGKLRDLLDARSFAETMRLVLVEGVSLREAGERASGKKLGWFFRQWGRAHPKVNYSLGPRRRDHEGTRWKHTIVVRKDSPPGETPPVEPVEVRVHDGAGRRHDLVWDGRGDEGEVSFVSDVSTVTSVEIDPRRRLHESGRSASSDDPRFDNRDPPRFKFLYNGFGALLNFSDLSLGLLWDFSFRRVHDTRNDLRLTIFSSRGVTIGGSIGYSRHFGRAVTPIRRAASVGATLRLSRLDGDFTDSEDATRLSLSVGVGTDDRLYLFHPLSVRGASIGASASVTRFDGSGDLRRTGSIAGDLTRIFTPVEGHTIVANLEGALVFGDIVSRSQLLGAGGPGGLRGYLADELFGRARVLGHLEWRGAIRSDLDVNVGHWIVVRGIGAALFVDGGAISSCDAVGDLLDADNLYANVGFGVRTFYDNLGVQQGMMALDFAIPLVLRPRECLDRGAEMRLDRPPLMLYLTFVPPF
jgi:hypothetical protein